MIATKSLQISQQNQPRPCSAKTSSLASQTKEKSKGRRRRKRKRIDQKKGIRVFVGRHCVSEQTITGQKERERERRAKSALLFMAILILKWYLMSHQARTDLSRTRGYNPHSRPLLSVGLAIVGIRIHTCVFVLPLPATPIYHTGVQTTVSSYRMVHHGVSVTYTLFGYPASRPRLLPSFSFLTRAVYARLRLSRAASVRAFSFLRRRSLRWPRCFAKRERLYPARSTDNRRATFFVITPLSLFSINSDFRNENFKIFSSKFIYEIYFDIS